jgi:hypothetical protein
MRDHNISGYTLRLQPPTAQAQVAFEGRSHWEKSRKELWITLAGTRAMHGSWQRLAPRTANEYSGQNNLNAIYALLL